MWASQHTEINRKVWTRLRENEKRKSWKSFAKKDIRISRYSSSIAGVYGFLILSLVELIHPIWVWALILISSSEIRIAKKSMYHWRKFSLIFSPTMYAVHKGIFFHDGKLWFFHQSFPCSFHFYLVIFLTYIFRSCSGLFFLLISYLDRGERNGKKRKKLLIKSSSILKNNVGGC